MSIVVISTRWILNDVIKPESKLLYKILDECHKLGWSNEIEESYKSGIKKHGGPLRISLLHNLDNVYSKLSERGKIKYKPPSGIEAKVKGVKIRELIGKHKKYRKFVQQAIGLNADYLITDTKAHLSASYELKRKHGVEVLTPDAWCNH